jgi:hypothetical protein
MKINLSKLDKYSSNEKFEKIKRKKPTNWKSKPDKKSKHYGNNNSSFDSI